MIDYQMTLLAFGWYSIFIDSIALTTSVSNSGLIDTGQAVTVNRIGLVNYLQEQTQWTGKDCN